MQWMLVMASSWCTLNSYMSLMILVILMPKKVVDLLRPSFSIVYCIAGSCLFKVNEIQKTFTCSRTAIEILEKYLKICSKLKMKAPEWRHWRWLWTGKCMLRKLLALLFWLKTCVNIIFISSIGFQYNMEYDIFGSVIACIWWFFWDPKENYIF